MPHMINILEMFMFSLEKYSLYSFVLSFLLINYLFFLIHGHTKDDPILTLTRSYHVNTESEWFEVPLSQVPRYLTSKQVIFHTIIPKYDLNSTTTTTEYRIQPEFDLKISFLFDHYQKLATPWIIVYDSIGRRSLKTLEIIFIHDAFEIVKVVYKTKYGSKLSRIDPTHPTLRGFELIYSWENVQEEDVALGIQVLFASVTIGVCIIISMMFCAVDLDYAPSISSNDSTRSSSSSTIHRSNSGKIISSPSLGGNSIKRFRK